MKHHTVGSTNGRFTWPASLWLKFLKSFSLGLLPVFLLVSFSFGLDEETINYIKKLKEAGLSDQAIVEILDKE